MGSFQHGTQQTTRKLVSFYKFSYMPPYQIPYTVYKCYKIEYDSSLGQEDMIGVFQIWDSKDHQDTGVLLEKIAIYSNR